MCPTLGSILGMFTISGLIGGAITILQGFDKTSLMLRLSAGSLSLVLGIIIISRVWLILL